MVDDGIDHTEPFALGCGRDILRMDHLRSDVDHASAEHLTVFVTCKQHDVVRETLLQKQYFVERMNRTDTVASLQIVRQNVPEGGIVGALSDGNAALGGFLQSVTAVFLPSQRPLQHDGRGNVALQERVAALMVDGIKVFFGGHKMIDPRHGLVDYPSDAFFTQALVHLADDLHQVNRGAVCRHHQAAVGQSLVREERVFADVGGQQGVETAFHVAHQRVVGEAVAVVVHVVAVEEERAVLRLRHKAVPFAAPAGVVSDNLYSAVVHFFLPI